MKKIALVFVTSLLFVFAFSSLVIGRTFLGSELRSDPDKQIVLYDSKDTGKIVKPTPVIISSTFVIVVNEKKPKNETVKSGEYTFEEYLKHFAEQKKLLHPEITDVQIVDMADIKKYLNVTNVTWEELYEYLKMKRKKEWQINYLLLLGTFKTIPAGFLYSHTDDMIGGPSDAVYSNLCSEWDSNKNGQWGELNGDIDINFLLNSDVAVGRIPFDDIDKIKDALKVALGYEYAKIELEGPIGKKRGRGLNSIFPQFNFLYAGGDCKLSDWNQDTLVDTTLYLQKIKQRISTNFVTNGSALLYPKSSPIKTNPILCGCMNHDVITSWDKMKPTHVILMGKGDPDEIKCDVDWQWYYDSTMTSATLYTYSEYPFFKEGYPENELTNSGIPAVVQLWGYDTIALSKNVPGMVKYLIEENMGTHLIEKRAAISVTGTYSIADEYSASEKDLYTSLFTFAEVFNDCLFNPANTNQNIGKVLLTSRLIRLLIELNNLAAKQSQNPYTPTIINYPREIWTVNLFGDPTIKPMMPKTLGNTYELM